MILLVEVLVCTMLKLYIESYQEWDSYLGPQPKINFSSIITDILSFLILFNYIVPISLYVTVGKTLLLAHNFFLLKLFILLFSMKLFMKHLQLFKLFLLKHIAFVE